MSDRENEYAMDATALHEGDRPMMIMMMMILQPLHLAPTDTCLPCLHNKYRGAKMCMCCKCRAGTSQFLYSARWNL